jgi:transposase-like protein
MENGPVSKTFTDLFRQYNPLNATGISLQDALTLSRYEGITEERTRILMWVEEHSNSFTLESLITFIKEEYNE